jgi:MFS family permease
MSIVSKYLPFASSTTAAQASAYLFAVCLFSISFLVFLNSSVSFVVTDLIGVKDGVGDLVGTLGFADELVALVACPVWGILSDRLGVRIVCVAGYTIVGLALFLFVQARNVYPQLLLARIFFSIGGAATATMVTAILPSMTGGKHANEPADTRRIPRAGLSENLRHSVSPSLDSELTITPASYNRRSKPVQTSGPCNDARQDRKSSSPPRLAGLVGVFTGCGALVALGIFLPLPAQFSRHQGVTQAQAVADSFYVVGGISFLVAVFCFLGLRGLQGEEGKGWRLLFGKTPLSGVYDRIPHDEEEPEPAYPTFLPYWRLLLDSTILGFNDAQIGLGYLGGFVARASSVGISLFIPLYINAYFIRNGFCQGSPNDPSPELKKECRAAYILAAELTGVSQLVALLCAPLFGYLSDRYRRFNIPLLVASVFGIVGYTAFANLTSPEPKDINGRGGTPAVFLIVSMIGISQIGAIVCSLGLLGRGVLGDEGGYNLSGQLYDTRDALAEVGDEAVETAPLIAVAATTQVQSRSHLKGSIAGVYSLSGGAAILLLTKLGGYLFDSLSTGAPFYMMAIFNAILLVIGIGAAIYQEIRTRRPNGS